jgi:ribosomal protein S18 acetylase RimI-like enzyme
MARVHLASWRSTYAGVLPDHYLANLSVSREAAIYELGLVERRGGHAGFVAIADASEWPEAGGGVVGFATGGLARRPGIADGEIETLYVLDDFRDRGLGRRLMRGMASHLASLGARSAFAWVLEANASRFFYERLGARQVAREDIRYAGATLAQRAYGWTPIDDLLSATAGTRLRRDP